MHAASPMQLPSSRAAPHQRAPGFGGRQGRINLWQWSRQLVSWPQCKMPSWNINQPAAALSSRQTASQNPREFFSHTGLFSLFSVFFTTGKGGGRNGADGGKASQYRAKRSRQHYLALGIFASKLGFAMELSVWCDACSQPREERPPTSFAQPSRRTIRDHGRRLSSPAACGASGHFRQKIVRRHVQRFAACGAGIACM